MSKQILKTEITDGIFAISIGTDTLFHALKYGLETRIGEVDFTNEDAFLKDFLAELVCESEDGTTPIHRLLDQAAYDAICNGAQGVIIPPGIYEQE